MITYMSKSRSLSMKIPSKKGMLTKKNSLQDDISPASSFGDSGSPKMPPPSDDFSNALIKLRFGSNYCPPNLEETYCSDDEFVTNYRGILSKSSFSSSISAPVSTSNTPKPRRTVRFDEATITNTAEFGETAARFRSLCIKKRNPTNFENKDLSTVSFGGSRNITITHQDLDDHSLNQRSSFKQQRSIFDTCDILRVHKRST